MDRNSRVRSSLPLTDVSLSFPSDRLMKAVDDDGHTGVQTAKELHEFLKARGKADNYPLFTFVVRPRISRLLDACAWADGVWADSTVLRMRASSRIRSRRTSRLPSRSPRLASQPTQATIHIHHTRPPPLSKKTSHQSFIDGFLSPWPASSLASPVSPPPASPRSPSFVRFSSSPSVLQSDHPPLGQYKSDLLPLLSPLLATRSE